MERLSAFGVNMMNPGTLYRTLRQMENNGLMRSKWETSKGGAARRVYSITDAGETCLDFWAESLEQCQKEIDAFFQIYHRWPATDGRTKTTSSEGSRVYAR
jgi:poly-beta-hydroxybutyrate-responsive repressor